jgi:hypothetical protein
VLKIGDCLYDRDVQNKVIHIVKLFLENESLMLLAH